MIIDVHCFFKLMAMSFHHYPVYSFKYNKVICICGYGGPIKINTMRNEK